MSRLAGLSIVLVLMFVICDKAEAAFTQASLTGDWSGTFSVFGSPCPINFTVDATGTITGGTCDYGSGTTTVAGKLTLIANVTATFQFPSVGYTAMGIIVISSPGMGGSPNRMTGTVKWTTNGAVENVDVSGGSGGSGGGGGGAVTPPSILSALTAKTVLNTAFGYTIQASGSQPMTFGASPLPPGLVLSGSQIVGTPTQAGTYVINLTATNGAGSDTESLVLRVLDHDDTIYDHTMPILPFNLQEFRGGLSAGSGLLIVKGTLPLINAFENVGARIDLTIGALRQTVQLNRRGKAVATAGGTKIAIAMGKGRAALRPSNVKFSILISGDLVPVLPSSVGASMRIGLGTSSSTFAVDVLPSYRSDRKGIVIGRIE